MKRSDRELGMGRPITRRDFLSGVGVAITGSALAGPGMVSTARAKSAAAESATAKSAPAVSPSGLGQETAYYPPGAMGMRGSHEGSFEVAHALRDGARWDDLGPEAETGEDYDLVVVGGGLSGLAAAYFYRKQVGPEAHILVLDNCDDFGGHATRNEFQSGGRTLLTNGGTINIEDLSAYDEPSRAMLRELGLDVGRYAEFHDAELYPSLGLAGGVFFDEETFGTDRLVVGQNGVGLQEFLARTPLSEPARRDIARLFEDQVDYLPGQSLAEKKSALTRMSYLQFLTDLVKGDAGVLPYFRTWRQGYWGIGNDELPAEMARVTGFPGFQGMGFSDTPPSEGIFPVVTPTSDQYFRFPDGMASVARMLVRSMIPATVPGNSAEDIVTAPVDYAQLDRDGAPVRIRLNSTAVHVRHVGDSDSSREVEVTYVRSGQAQKVRSGSCVLACYNAMIPYLCPELPDEQRTALRYSLKAPKVYSSVLIRNWTAFQRLGLREAFCPGSYHDSVGLCDPVSIGEYRCPQTPDEPMVLQLYRVPLTPGVPAPEQWTEGMAELETTTFEEFERQIRDQLGRMLSGGGFDPARDIEAITVNRWPHGYGFGYDPTTDRVAWTSEWPVQERPWLKARQPFGRIAIANCDAANNAMAEASFSEAYRAVREVLS
jgi:spermidine dehydrogenase